VDVFSAKVVAGFFWKPIKRARLIQFSQNCFMLKGEICLTSTMQRSSRKQLAGKLMSCLLLFFLWPCPRSEARERTINVCPDAPAQFKEIQKQAAANVPKAQATMASCYELGRNVKPSRTEVIRWLMLAAKQEYAPAEYELGRIYLYGRGVPADYTQALIWEERAAGHGQRRAQRDLAYMYERGFGVNADAAQAAAWNRKAADQGDPQGQLYLAQALETGTGVPKDIAEAMQWYAKAAKQDLTEAQLHMARIYAQDGNAPCWRAISWYDRAAENGDAQAMYELGKLYQTARCGNNLQQAAFWLGAGVRFGSQESQPEVQKLNARLTPAQKKTADREVERWIARYSAQKKDDDDDKEGH